MPLNHCPAYTLNEVRKLKDCPEEDVRIYHEYKKTFGGKLMSVNDKTTPDIGKKVVIKIERDN